MEIIHLEEIGSTNEYVKNNITNLNDKSLVFADRQISGHGRLGRTWVDTGDENLYLTFVLKPFKEMNPIYANLTQYLSLILCYVLEEEYNLKPQIKWPNDVLVNNKKIAGILSEGTTQAGVFQGLALGIGVNLNTPNEKLAKIDKPATSILSETTQIVDKTEFIKKLCTKFFLLYDNFIEKGFSSIKSFYTDRASFLGKDISINVLGDVHRGIAMDVSDDGSLILRESDKDNVYFIGDIL